MTKFSEVPNITEDQIALDDTIFVLDKSATSGPQSGPGGTVKGIPNAKLLGRPTKVRDINNMPPSDDPLKIRVAKYLNDLAASPDNVINSDQLFSTFFSYDGQLPLRRIYYKNLKGHGVYGTGGDITFGFSGTIENIGLAQFEIIDQIIYQNTNTVSDVNGVVSNLNSLSPSIDIQSFDNLLTYQVGGQATIYQYTGGNTLIGSTETPISSSDLQVFDGVVTDITPDDVEPPAQADQVPVDGTPEFHSLPQGDETVFGWLTGNDKNWGWLLQQYAIQGVFGGYYETINGAGTNLFNSQESQITGNLYLVRDASFDTNVTTGFGLYKYLGTTVGDLTDYELQTIKSLNTVDPEIVTTLPSTVPIDGTKIYHIDGGGVIKPATSGNVDGKSVQIITNANENDTLQVDLRDFPNTELMGGGYTESPSGLFTLDTTALEGVLKQHLTEFLWNRNVLRASNSPAPRIDTEVRFSSASNQNDQYALVSFNKTIQQADLVLSNFTRTFTQGADDATDVTLTEVQDQNGNAISEDTSIIRILFTITGTSTGAGFFTITAASLSDLFGNTSTNKVSPNVSLIGNSLNEIEDYTNVIAYWKEGQGDNTSGTATKTDIKNSKVLTAVNYANPTLASTEWIFDGVNDGFEIQDTPINDLINAATRDFQIHYKGNFKDSASSRLVAATAITIDATDGHTDFAYKAGIGNAFVFIRDVQADTISQNTGIALTLNTDYAFSVRYYDDAGTQRVDVYINDGTTEQSFLALDIDIVDALNVQKLFIGVRELAGPQFYNVGFRELAIATGSDNFDAIKTRMAE